MDSGTEHMDFHLAQALLGWQMELGADEPIGDGPLNRYELPAVAPKTVVVKPQTSADASVVTTATADPVVVARNAVNGVVSLGELSERQAAYELCDLRKGARNFVFADGNPAARVMIIGEAPGKDEDALGRPFVGLAGQLLDRMFAAIGLSRQSSDPLAAVYITNVMPWRPPQNRDPDPAEIAMMLPFLERHVELVAPEIIVLMGNVSCYAALGARGVMRLRGKWTEAFGRPAMPMTHPAYLLRTPAAKREAWMDLLEIKARLKELT